MPISEKSLANLRPFTKRHIANPAGRPKNALSKALRKKLDEVEQGGERANAEVIAAKLVELACGGNIEAAQLVGDRAEGRPRQSVTLSTDTRERVGRADLLSLNSHEAQGDRDTYRDYGLSLRKWTVDYQDGIDEITDRLMLRDLHEPHLFRPQLTGRPTLYIVVADGEGELLLKPMGERHVQQARSVGGMMNLLRQIARSHYSPEEQGDPASQMRPRKNADDLVADLRAYATHRWPRPLAISEAERRELRLAPALRAAAFASMTDSAEIQRAAQNRHIQLKRMRAEAEREAERARRMATPRVRFRK